jgi:hypothetical protein
MEEGRRNEGIMTTLLFTINISAEYRGTKEIYSAQVIERNGMKLYHLAEAPSISEALETVVQEMRVQEKNSASVRSGERISFLTLSESRKTP